MPKLFATLTQALVTFTQIFSKQNPTLVDAIKHNNIELMQDLIRHANIHQVTHGQTPLHIAAIEGQLDAVKILIGAGADIDARNAQGVTPLQLAAHHQRPLDMIQFLLTCAQQDIQHYGRYPLHEAIYHGLPTVVKPLLEAGIKANDSDSHGHTPLFTAAGKNQLPIVAQLIAAQGKVNQANEHGSTPLQVAALTGNLEIAKLLLENGADINQADNHGDTPLHHAALGGHLAMVTRLIAAGAEVNARNNQHCSALFYSAIEGNAQIASTLLAAGSKLNTRDQYGSTPLHQAAQKNQVEIVKTLVNAKAWRNAKNHAGQSPVALTTHSQIQSLLTQPELADNLTPMMKSKAQKRTAIEASKEILSSQDRELPNRKRLKYASG